MFSRMQSDDGVGSNGPSYEMSQDCPIEWDESDNIDLRQLAKSPRYATPGGSPSNAETPNALDDIKRRLLVDKNDEGVSSNSLQTQPASVTKSRNQVHQAEDEIDGIFSILKREESLDKKSPSSAPTQKTSNPRRPAPSIPAPKPVEAGLASRYRRRRRITESNSHVKRRRTLEDTGNRSPEKPRHRSEEIEGESELEALLKQLTAPAEALPSRSPLQTINKNSIDETSKDSLKNCSDKGIEKLVTKDCNNRSWGISLDEKGGPNSLVTLKKKGQNSSLISALPTVTTKPAATTPGDTKLQPTYCQQISKLPALAKSGDDDDEFGDLSFDDDEMADLDVLLSIKSSQQPLPPLLSQSVKGKSKTVLKVIHKHNRKPLSQPAANFRAKKAENLPVQHDHKPIAKSEQMLGDETIATVRGLKSSEESKDDSSSDEFGDFPDINFDEIDVCSQKQYPSLAAVVPKVQSSVLKTESISVVPRASSASVLQCNEEVKDNPPPDDFGDFPDFDFSEIDKAVQIRLTQSSQPAAPADLVARQRRNFGPLSFPTNKQVKNQKTLNWNHRFAFATFSRYVVVEVHVDNSTWTKRLSVTAWDESMAADEEKKLSIHRNVEVSKSTKILQPSQIPLHIDKIAYTIHGYLHLRGEWYHTQISPGDTIHLCSLSGRYRTDPEALPIILHTSPPQGSEVDDLVLVIHPDLLMTPTTVSETVGCSRRAVLKSRIGSTGLSSISALVGTMRHSLFESCIKEQNFDERYVRRKVQKIVRNNAESLLSCGLSTVEAERDVHAVLPMIKRFISDYTDFGKLSNSAKQPSLKLVEGYGSQPDIRLMAHSSHSVEEPLVSHELALKGNVDVILRTTSVTLGTQSFAPGSPINSLMGLELKTGHNQTTQHAHLAQLALYILLLQISYGVEPPEGGEPDLGTTTVPDRASSGAILLYLNQNDSRVVHISPLLAEIKSLIGQRNVAATGVVQASRPRGIALVYDEENLGKESETTKIDMYAAPPAQLPQILPSAHPCTRCYVNRECMLYAAAEIDESDLNLPTRNTHKEIFDGFVGHLTADDISYFREWDRLIDLEADASNRSIALSWLKDSRKLEDDTGESISSLVYHGAEPSGEGRVVMVFKRKNIASQVLRSLDSLLLSQRDQVVISTDSTSFSGYKQRVNDNTTSAASIRRKFRHRMHIVRGSVEKIEKESIFISGTRDDLERVRDIVQRHRKHFFDQGDADLLFRVDKDTVSIGTGTLRQNVINLFTADSPRAKCETDSPSLQLKQRRLPRLRDIVIRLKPPQFFARPHKFFFGSRQLGIPGCDLSVLSQEFSALNSDQQKAVEKVINAKDFAMIQGLPGTGKTSTLSFITRLLAGLGKRVLVTSYTHSAVDNVVSKLLEKGVNPPTLTLPSLVRIGNISSCHDRVRPYHVSTVAGMLESITLSQQSSQENGEFLGKSSQNDATHTPPASPEYLKKVVSSARIVCCTALTAPRSPLLVDQSFDVVIVDEAGQISQPAILGALMSADVFVLVGDHLQLPPLVTSEAALHGGFGISLLKKLADAHPSSIAPLTYQYRMNEDICRISSDAVYNGMLKCGNSVVSSQILELPHFPAGLPSKVSPGVYGWLRMVIDPERRAIFVDTDNIKKEPRSADQIKETKQDEGIEALETKLGGKIGGNVVNPTEAALVRYVVSGLVSSGLDASALGIISPFRAQIGILKDNPNIAGLMKDGLELSTIDRYQGRDKSAIILSCTRSNRAGKVGRLLQDIRRLNVAMTRAKKKLIIIGSFSTLQAGSEPFKSILESMDARRHRFLLPENALQCYRIP